MTWICCRTESQSLRLHVRCLPSTSRLPCAYSGHPQQGSQAPADSWHSLQTHPKGPLTSPKWVSFSHALCLLGSHMLLDPLYRSTSLLPIQDSFPFLLSCVVSNVAQHVIFSKNMAKLRESTANFSCSWLFSWLDVPLRGHCQSSCCSSLSNLVESPW